MKSKIIKAKACIERLDRVAAHKWRDEVKSILTDLVDVAEQLEKRKPAPAKKTPPKSPAKK